MFSPVVASKQNCSVIDVDGNQYIDVSLCDGMVSFGHAYMFKAGLKRAVDFLPCRTNHMDFLTQ